MRWIECCTLPKFIGLRKQAETDYIVYDFNDVCEENHERVRKLHHRPKKSQKWKQLLLASFQLHECPLMLCRLEQDKK